MIFVTVGTHEQPFNRLIQKIDELKKDGTIQDVPTSRQNKVRALVMMICPSFIPFLMKLRKLKYKVDV